jgi:GST-like protein
MGGAAWRFPTCGRNIFGDGNVCAFDRLAYTEAKTPVEMEAMMDRTYVVYGQRGSGSIPVEATLLLLGEPYRVIERAPLESPEVGGVTEREMDAINPMQQVPALRLPDGRLMTESAAILIHLADTHPEARLSPAPDAPERPDFLRWMIFVAAQIYGLYWARDDSTRLAADKAHEAVIMERTADRIAHCWRVMDTQIRPGRYILGDDLSVLDLYVTVVSCWGPRRERFTREAPVMADIVRRVDGDPRLTAFWAERFS